METCATLYLIQLQCSVLAVARNIQTLFGAVVFVKQLNLSYLDLFLAPALRTNHKYGCMWFIRVTLSQWPIASTGASDALHAQQQSQEQQTVHN
eukprot:2849587-Amphidinium_carterae.2